MNNDIIEELEFDCEDYDGGMTDSYFDVNGTTKKFKIKRIVQPKQWEDAESLKTNFNMKVSDGDSLRFSVKGISLFDWEEVEQRNIIPQYNGNSRDIPDSFRAEQDAILESKRVELIEIATGMKIPGETAADKVNLLKQRCESEVEALNYFITKTLSNLVEGDLLEELMLAMSADSSKVNIKTVSSFNDWSVAEKTKHIFRMQRPFQDFIIEIPLRGIDSKTIEEIDKETKEPDPPQRPKRLPNGRFDPSETEPLLNDPSYQASVRAIQRKRTIMLLEACLPFKIPGDSIPDKYSWLSKKTVGDVIKLRLFIEQQFVNYTSKFDFFTRGSGLMSW